MGSELAAWEIYLRVEGGRAISDWRYGVLVSRWIEGHLSVAEHRDPPPGQLGLKPFAVGPIENRDGLTRVRVGTVGTDNAERLLRGAWAAARTPVGLGQLACAVVPVAPGDPARLVDHATFGGLLDAARPVRRLVLASLSPTYFRGSEAEAVPHAHRVFGALRRRWRAFADTVEVDVDFNQVGLRLEYDATRTVTGELYRNRRAEKVDGFTGLASYVAGVDGPDTEPMRRGLHALARLADFVGIGSSTVQGFGATRLLATA
jgi:CRISPR-associated endoribonuclease Cas6